jgi:two-component system, cell cycle response regulator
MTEPISTGQPAVPNTLPSPQRPATADRTAHILVVDDSRTNRSLLARRLEQNGHTVTNAEHGRDALALMASQSFDLVLLDVLMPELDGYQVLASMKQDTALRDIPVIMISAVDEIESVVRCIELGAEDYLPKPFDPVLLRARINACIEKKFLRDQEVQYLQQVNRVTTAATAVEAGTFDPSTLSDIAARTDALGGLARVFQRMAHEVRAREERLKQQLEALSIKIDEDKKAAQVAEITDTEYFQHLQREAGRLRARPRDTSGQ